MAGSGPSRTARDQFPDEPDHDDAAVHLRIELRIAIARQCAGHAITGRDSFTTSSLIR